jgi:hypothetical protein
MLRLVEARLRAAPRSPAKHRRRPLRRAAPHSRPRATPPPRQRDRPLLRLSPDRIRPIPARRVRSQVSRQTRPTRTRAPARITIRPIRVRLRILVLRTLVLRIQVLRIPERRQTAARPIQAQRIRPHRIPARIQGAQIPEVRPAAPVARQFVIPRTLGGLEIEPAFFCCQL